MVRSNSKYQSDVEFESTAPENGDIPFKVGYIDHTELDVELVGSRIKVNLGHPWATFLSDGHSKRILGVYLTFDLPSYRSCMMVMRECFRRYGRLPNRVVVNKGKEFNNVSFENLLAAYSCVKKVKAAKPRFKLVCEPLFGISSKTLIERFNLIATSESGNQHVNAVWTLGSLYKYLCYWCYEFYDNEKHPVLQKSTKKVFNKSCLQASLNKHKNNHDENLDIFTFSTTNTGTAKVIPNLGVRINYIYYWHYSLQHPDVERSVIPVRYDPNNIGIAYAYVKIQWVTCISQCYEKFARSSEKLIMMIAEELRQQHQKDSKRFVVTASRLARYLDGDEQAECIVLQRVKDFEVQELLSLINRISGNYFFDTNVFNFYNSQAFIDFQKESSSDEITPYEEFW